MHPEALDDTMKQTLRCALALATITFSALVSAPSLPTARTGQSAEVPGSADRQAGTEVARCYSCPAWSQIPWRFAGTGSRYEPNGVNEAG
jgi:hypothetical protein